MSDTIKIGMDLGDKYHIAVVFDAKGNELEVGKVINSVLMLALSADFLNPLSAMPMRQNRLKALESKI
jgi:hypothetical protein